MPSEVRKTINVEVEGHSRWKEGLEKGVKFLHIKGFWTPSRVNEGLCNNLKGSWPPPVGTRFLAELKAKPKRDPGKYFCDVMDVKAANGEPVPWDWESDLSAAGSGGTGQPPTPAGNSVPWGGNQPPQQTAGDRADNRDASIRRQCVLKAEAVVVAGLLRQPDEQALAALARFEQHARELWGDGYDGTVPQQPAATPPPPAEDAPDDDPDDPMHGELNDSDIPF